MTAPATIETARLLLRPLTAADAPAIQARASDYAIAHITLAIPHPYPDGAAETYIHRQETQFQVGRSLTFALTLRQAETENLGVAECLGVIELRDLEPDHAQVELGFWLGADAWGKGYMSEAVGGVVRFSFEQLDLNRLYAYHMVRNPASGKVLQKNGFVQEGYLRQRIRKWGVFEDVTLWAILRRDWQASGT